MQDALIVAVASYPGQLLPPATDEASALLLDLLYDPLYRLDEQLVPQPRLAAALPTVSEDGLTWTIDLAPGDLRFTDGDPVTAADVVTTLRIAHSSACSLGRELCATAQEYLDSVDAVDDHQVRIVLSEPYAPFLAEVLAQLPILDDMAVRAGAATLERGASRDPRRCTRQARDRRLSRRRCRRLPRRAAAGRLRPQGPHPGAGADAHQRGSRPAVARRVHQ